MSKKATEVTDPVRVAERAVAEARAALAANLKEAQARTQSIAEVEEALGADPEAKDCLRQGAMLQVHLARIKRLTRDERVLHQAVTAAESGLKEALAARAQAEITQQDETLDRLNGEIINGLAAMLKAVEEHERIVAARDALAHDHNLPTPGRRRFLFAAAVLRSRECELLRDRLDVRYAAGGIQEKASEGMAPVWSMPAAT